MLLSYFLDRSRTPRAQGQPFRWRGEGVSRIEGLSDTVFGFAITLLVVSLEVPKTAADLLQTMLGVIPFVGSFTALFVIWRAQFDFFRRYGLEDKATVRLTGMLLMGVLFAVYPVKFLFTFILLTLPRALLTGQGEALKQVMPIERIPQVFGLYGLGLLWVGLVFNRLYAHAWRSRDTLELSELETYDTEDQRRRWGHLTALGAFIVAWSAAVLATGAHLRARDDVFGAVYYGGEVGLVLFALTRIRLRRRGARERDLLVTRLAVAGPENSGASADTDDMSGR
jgi:hypothetical protein